MVVLLDLSAAFAAVSHSILTQRLNGIGLDWKALDGLKDFLADRTQGISLHPFNSRNMTIDKGVPLGSSLSPTLFNIYMALLAKIVRT